MRQGALPVLALVALLFVAGALGGQAAFAATDDDNRVDPAQRSDNSFIYDTTIESLYEQSSLYESQTVQIEGEVIGDKIAALGDDGYSWITLTVVDAQDKTSISVLLSDEQAPQIDRYGKYGVTGTILKVRGTFHQACTEHDGLPDVHATYSESTARGVDHFDAFDARDFGPGVVTVLIGTLLLIAFRFARERMR